RGPAACRVNRETAGKTECIQHAAAACQRFHLAAVLALVEEKAGLLPAQNVGLEAQAAFLKNNWSAELRFGSLRENDFPIALLELFFRDRLDVAAQTENDAFARHIFPEQRERVVQTRQPRRRVKFQHERRVVAIQHEAGPAVAFAVDEAVTGRLRIEQITAAGERLLQPRLPPRALNR